MLTIRDEQVRLLAQDLMRRAGLPTMTGAIRIALQNEIAIIDGQRSLNEGADTPRHIIPDDTTDS